MASKTRNYAVDLFKRLSSSVYIHSATDNFVEISRQYLIGTYKGWSSSSLEAEAELEAARQVLLSQIESITYYCNSFYQDMGITQVDSFIVSEGGEGNFNLAGARAFQEKYLMKKESGKSMTQKLLNIINTPAYQRECIKKAKTILDTRQTQSISDSKAFLDLMNTIGSRLGQSTKKIWNGVANITGDILQESLSALIETKTSNGRTRTRFKKTVQKNIEKGRSANDPNSIYSIIFSDHGEELNLNTNEGVKKARANFESYFLKVSINELVDIMWEVVMTHDQSLLPLQQTFKDFFQSELSNYTNIDFTTNLPAFTGMQLEQPFIFGMELDLKRIFANSTHRMIARGLGQTTENKTFRDGSSISGTASGSDFIFEKINAQGAVVQSYRIQAKNSLKDQDFLTIRLNDQIKLDTYARRMLSDEDASKLEYFLLNRAFLSQYGFVRGDEVYYDTMRHHKGELKEKKYSLSSEENQQFEAYILFFLNQTIAYLIGGKVYQEGSSWNTNTQNLFFIYQGKYMIPVSIFLYSAYELIVELKKNLGNRKTFSKMHIEGGSTIGELTYVAKLKNLNAGAGFARQLRSDKFYYLNHRTDVQFQEDHGNGVIYNHSYRYPENLVEIGSSAGKRFLQEAAFPRINFRMHLKAINNLLP